MAGVDTRTPEDPIVQALKRQRISALYHFTSIRNLHSIARMQALCSKGILEGARQWPPPEPGGNKLSHGLDRYNENWDKCSLNFTPYTPMAYRKKREMHLCFFLLHIEVAGMPGILFTDTNATAEGHRRGAGLAGLSLVNFEAIRALPRPGDRDGWHRPVQAEVLVPGNIPLTYVERVVFVSEVSRREGERLWGGTHHPRFDVAPEYFADIPRKPITIDFPYVQRILVTDQQVDASTTPHLSAYGSRFRRKSSGSINLVTWVHALVGTKATVVCEPLGEVEAEFPLSKDYRHLVRISMNDLSDEFCSVQYYLNGIFWAQLDFELMTP